MGERTVPMIVEAGAAAGVPVKIRSGTSFLDLALDAMPELVAYQRQTLAALDVDLDRLLP